MSIINHILHINRWVVLSCYSIIGYSLRINYNVKLVAPYHPFNEILRARQIPNQELCPAQIMHRALSRISFYFNNIIFICLVDPSDCSRTK